MHFKQTMHQIQPDKEYGGVFTFGSKEFSYSLLFKVPVSKMDREIKKREKRGQDLSSLEVKRELFVLTIAEQKGQQIDLSDDATYELLVTMACMMAAEVSQDVLTEGFNQLFGEDLSESFISHERESKVFKKDLPKFLQRIIGKP